MIKMLQVSDLYSPKEQWASYVINAIKAKELHSKNVNYIVRNKEVSSNWTTCKQSCLAGFLFLFSPQINATLKICVDAKLASPLHRCNLLCFSTAFWESQPTSLDGAAGGNLSYDCKSPGCLLLANLMQKV